MNDSEMLTYPEVVVRCSTTLEDAKTDIARVLCRKALHPFEQSSVQKDRVDSLLAHYYRYDQHASAATPL